MLLRSFYYCLLNRLEKKKKTAADHAGSSGDICMGEMVLPKACIRIGGGTRKVTHIFFFTKRGNELGIVTFFSLE